VVEFHKKKNQGSVEKKWKKPMKEQSHLAMVWGRAFYDRGLTLNGVE
jgi:hypothetical protein